MPGHKTRFPAGLTRVNMFANDFVNKKARLQ